MENILGKKAGEVFIIADIGKNFIQTKEDRPWREYLINAKELARLAKEAGADAVKFQTHYAEDEQLNISIRSPHFLGSDRYDWVKRNDEATPLEFWQELKKYCEEIGAIFFSTPMSRGAAMKKLNQVGVALWKIGSGDILDFVMLDFIRNTGLPIILSTGMSTEEEIDQAVKFIREKNNKLIILHCVSKYPCPPEELNLGTIKYLNKRYGVPVGFSDHSLGWDSAAASVNLGAVVIEKHFSLSRDFWGADHQVSMSPAEFKEMVKAVRRKNIVKPGNYGKEEKNLLAGEEVFRPFFRKSLTAGRDMPIGTILAAEMIYAMRPQKFAGGLPSEEYPKVLGRRIIKELKKYEPITNDVLQSNF